MMLFTYINNGFSLLEIFQKCYTFVNNVVIMYLLKLCDTTGKLVYQSLHFQNTLYKLSTI